MTENATSIARTRTPYIPLRCVKHLGAKETCMCVNDTHNPGQPEEGNLTRQAEPPPIPANEPDAPATFTLTIRSEGHHVAPVAVRLRRCLKSMLRTFGLRCVDIRTDTRKDAHDGN